MHRRRPREDTGRRQPQIKERALDGAYPANILILDFQTQDP